MQLNRISEQTRRERLLVTPSSLTNDRYPERESTADSGSLCAATRSPRVVPRNLSIGESQPRRPKGVVRLVGPAPRGPDLPIVPPTPACDSRLPLLLRRLSSRR